MVTLAAIRRAYDEAGPVNRLLALWGFVDDTTFLTKAGHVGVVYRVRGLESEGLTPPQRQALVHRCESALRLLDERCRVSQYLVKRRVPLFAAATSSRPLAHEALQQRAAYLNSRRQDLYVATIYLVLLYESPTVARTRPPLRSLWRAPGQTLRAWLSTRETVRLLDETLDRTMGTRAHHASALESQLSEFRLRRLQKTEAFQFFRLLVNYDAATVDAARLTHDTHLDYFVADSAIECHRDHLRVGGQYVQLLSMKEAPSQTLANALGGVADVPGEFVACLEWQRLPNDRVRRDVQMRRRHFFNSRVSLVNYLSSETRPEEMLVDDSASAMVRQLGDALTAMDVHGRVFGSASLTLVLHDLDPRAVHHQSAEARKVLAAHDASFFEESYNLLNAWLSLIPGNGAYNLRRLALLDTNLADLSFLFTRIPARRSAPICSGPRSRSSRRHITRRTPSRSTCRTSDTR